MNEEKKSQKVFVALTNMRGSHLDDVVFGVYEAPDLGAAQRQAIRELADEAGMSKSEAKATVEREFYFEETAVTKVKGVNER